MTQRRAKAALDGTRFADLEWTSATGSTQTDLIDRARSGAGECALVADSQSAGRGRLDRSFVAPTGASLMMSVLVRPPFPDAGPQLLTVALGIAAADAVRSLSGVQAALKWPNDLVVRTDDGLRKLGGILAQYVDGTPPAVVVGIGINVAWAPTGFPPELSDIATSLDLLGARVDRADLAVDILQRLDSIDLSTADGSVLLLARYRELSSTLGQRVRVELPDGNRMDGEAVDIDASGSLVVETADGVRQTVAVGDVVHLRTE